ncbi:Protein MAIN-LIKE 1 [Linum grandiflorum]
MSFGEMTIMLHNFFHILRIPIEGNPCIWKSGPNAYHVKSSKILDVSKAVVTNGFYYSGGYHVVKLLKHIGDGKVPATTSEAQIYLFCLLGCMLFTDSSRSHAKIGIIGGLIDVRLVAEKAWGGALAHMYRARGKASRVKGKNFYGCMTLLQSWIYEYFSSLSRRVDSPTRWDVGAPLVERWDGVRLGKHSGEEGQQRLDMLHAELDQLTHTHIQWLSYGSSPVSSDARWSQYFGDIHSFDFI